MTAYKNQRVLIVDGMNFLHRARSGFQMGPAPVLFNFVRNFRALVELMTPTELYFVLEGHPQQRIDALPQYKANRQVEPGTKKHEEMKQFYQQVDEIIDLLCTAFPVHVVRHPEFECDDTIYNLIRDFDSKIEVIVASNDSDFTQLLDEFENVRVYNPMLKTYVKKHDVPYVMWKALRGDGSDNIPGIPGIGDITATAALNDPDVLQEILARPGASEAYTRNVQLIRFISWAQSDTSKLLVNKCERLDNDKLRSTFEKYGFNSLLKEATWDKFVRTFTYMLCTL